MKTRILFFLCLNILFLNSPVSSAVIHVKKDGTGDFSIIQDAVDAATDGDTILIGPGRYVDFEPFDSGNWINEIIVVFQNKSNITLIGSGAESTIIGPTSYYAPNGEDPQIIMGWSADNIRLEGIRVENCEFGIVWNSGSLSVGNCVVSNCRRGVYSFSPDGTIIENSEFFQPGGGWSIVTNGECRDVTIKDSSFHGSGTGVGFNQTQNANVISCNFENLWTAIGYSGDSEGQVTGCNTSNVENPVFISTGSQLLLLDNVLEATEVSLFLSGNSHASGTRNVFSGGGTVFGTLNFSGGSTADLSGNHILRGEGLAVSLIYYFYEQYVINLTGNYWGTSNVETIEEWIHDGNDDSSIHGTVNFLPLADGPVPTENTTLDGLKAMYR